MPVRIHHYSSSEALAENPDSVVYMLDCQDEAGILADMDADNVVLGIMEGILNSGIDPQRADFAVSIVRHGDNRHEIRVILRSETERIPAAFCRFRLVPGLLFRVGVGCLDAAAGWILCENPFPYDGETVLAFREHGDFSRLLGEPDFEREEVYHESVY